MIFKVCNDFLLNALRALGMQNFIMGGQEINDFMSFKHLFNLVACLMVCHFVLFNTECHKLQFCQLS